MTQSKPFSTVHERRLDEVVAKYLAAHAAGQAKDHQQWLAEFPDLAVELAEFFADLDGMERLISSRPRSGSRPITESASNLENELRRSAAESGEPTEFAPLPRQSSSERYRLTRFHARGGMGEVWLAEDGQIGRRIAMKRLRPERANEYDRFLFEAQVTGRLEHPGIVPLHDRGRDEQGLPFYVMKFVQGQSLTESIAAFHAAKTNADWPRQLEFLRLLEAYVSVCRAVAYAHCQGVLHRNIKPDNIMTGSYGETLLLDWGLAKSFGQTDTNSHPGRPSSSPANSTSTQAGAVLGSPAYISPELGAGRADAANQRTDVYLLGGTLHQILTGLPPRVGSSQEELLNLARTVPAVPPRRVDSRIPRALEAICLKAMAHRQEDRYESAAALATDVERYLAGAPVAAYREPLLQRAWRWARRHRRGLYRALVSVLVLGLVAFAYAAHRRDIARGDLAEFRHWAEEAQFFAASTDSVGERAPYYDPQRAIAAGTTALSLASSWGPDGGRLPLPSERMALKNELYDLLLVLASAQCNAAARPDDPRKALELLDRAAAVRSPTRGYHLLRSRCLAQLGAKEDAQCHAELSEDPRTPSTAHDHFLAGELYRTQTLRQGPEAVFARRPDEEAMLHAIDEYRLSLRLEPRQYWTQFQLGRAYLSLGRAPEAVQALSACITMRPQAPWAYSTRALAYALSGQNHFADAHADLDQALRLDADFRPALLNRGFVYYLQSRHDEALAELKRALRPPAERQLIEAAYYRAQIHYERGAWAQAQEDCSAVIEQKPAFRPAYWLRARIRLRIADDRRGIQDLNTWLASAWGSAFNSSSAAAHAARGRALRELGVDLPGDGRKRVLTLALREFNHALTAGAPAEDLSRDLSTLPALIGDLEEGIQAFSRQLESAPHDRAARKRRAWAYHSLQQTELAIADFREVLRQSPHDAEAHTGLGYMFALSGRRPQAESEAALAALYGASDCLVLHNVACIYSALSRNENQVLRDYEDLAIAYLERAVSIYRQKPGSIDEIEAIRHEAAFPNSLRARPEFKKLTSGLGE